MDNGQELENLKKSFLNVIDEEISRLKHICELYDNESSKITRFFEDMSSGKEKVQAQIKILEEHKREIERGNYNFNAGPITGGLEDRIVDKQNLIDSLENQIDILEQRKVDEDLTSTDKSIIDNQISYKKKMIEKLKGKKTKLSNRQKSIVMKKVKLRGFRDRMLAKQEVRVAKSENKVEMLEAKQELLGDGVIDSLRANALETRKSFHEWKAGFDRDVLVKLQNSRLTGIAGARAIAIGKVALDRLRGRIIGRRKNDLSSMMPPQPQVQTATANTL